MADPVTALPDESNDAPDVVPSPVRRVGYSARGRAAPLGEPDERPLILPAPGAASDQAREAADLRQRYDAALRVFASSRLILSPSFNLQLSPFNSGLPSLSALSSQLRAPHH